LFCCGELTPEVCPSILDTLCVKPLRVEISYCSVLLLGVHFVGLNIVICLSHYWCLPKNKNENIINGLLYWIAFCTVTPCSSDNNNNNNNNPTS
jgi:hypothetical protein